LPSRFTATSVVIQILQSEQVVSSEYDCLQISSSRISRETLQSFGAGGISHSAPGFAIIYTFHLVDLGVHNGKSLEM
jgi:hypothetical protein